MNEKLILFSLLLITCLLPAQNQDINLGAINFPQAYIHAGMEFPQGYYGVVLTFKDAVPFFYVYDSKQELLFEELAVVKVHSGRKMTAPYRLKNELLKDKEFFRIMVNKSRSMANGLFPC